MLLTGAPTAATPSRWSSGARGLVAAGWTGPVVVAGSVEAHDEVASLLTGGGAPHVLADNVVPRIGVLAPESARAAIREMFLAHVIGGKHLSASDDFRVMVRGATPDLVLAGVELLARGLGEDRPGAGDVAVVDVGGATTDVHSVVALDPETMPREGVLSREVVAVTPVTRTVEGDLGMRWSALSTVEAAGLTELAAEASRRKEQPGYLPEDDRQADIDEQIAHAAVDLALRRHAGRSRVVEPRGPGGRAERQGPARDRPAHRLGWRAPQRPPRRRRPGARGAAWAPSSRAAGSCHARPAWWSTTTTRCARSGCSPAPTRTRRTSSRSASPAPPRPRSSLTPVTSEPEPSEQQRFAERFAHQWAVSRAERRAEPPPIEAGTTNLAKAQVPYGVDLAAAWSWRFLVIAAAGYLILWLLAFFAVITVPVVIALLIAALVSPLVRRTGTVSACPDGSAPGWSSWVGSPRWRCSSRSSARRWPPAPPTSPTPWSRGIEQIRDWLKDGPLQASDNQINDALAAIQSAITDSTAEGGVLTRTVEVGTAVGHAVAGFFIVLFSTYFFLADGERIWAWTVRLAPRAARKRVDESGQVAWRSLTKFVRATVLVAAVDALGIMFFAAILGVPFVLAIGVLVFLGAFVPMIGATIAGTVAVLVALVDQGPITALLMLGGVILVQQIEGHVLQPFLMGRFVSVHPLGVILAIGCGVLVAGIVGALIAVPLAAALNAVVQHLASHTDVGADDPEEELEEDRVEVAAAEAAPDQPGEGGGGDPADA